MELLLDRIYKGPKYTIGKLYIDGAYFCDTLEDVVRDLGIDGSGKIKHETAIPPGRYKVILSMSNRFKKVMPLLLSVPYFSGIRIHSGKDKEDTSGCPLVGDNKVKGKVLNSRKTFNVLMVELQIATTSGEEIYITVK